ncbi:3'-5' exonuclease [Nitrospirillum iridis]|uniref:DNA polymerase III epsilon subunit-like protein n=1 Tax=Nitrospirillum iridis TaxID=765888 RepID=A0A7X0EG06_9PROT|nr:3'-5' exonuclease [Nitrospirillum iridis]MBB6254505.1 DNA polymerase III epsilon subunit-like protein [Nitrospirillum iridis]
MVDKARIASARRWVAMDIEMTGFRAVEGRSIIEVSCVAVSPSATGALVREACSWRINPSCPLNPIAIGVHGVRAEDIADSPSFVEVVGEILDFIGDDPLVFHGAAGDIAVLNQELAAAGLPRLSNPVVCTEKLARQRWPEERSRLPLVAERLGGTVWQRHKRRRQRDGSVIVTGDYRHKSRADAEMTADVWLALGGPG